MFVKYVIYWMLIWTTNWMLSLQYARKYLMPLWCKRHRWRATVWRRKFGNRHCPFKIQAKNDSEGAPNMECIRQSKRLAGDIPSTSMFNHNRRCICKIKIREIVHRLWMMYNYNFLHPTGKQSRRLQTCHLQQTIIRSNLTSWWRILKEKWWTNRHWTYFYTFIMIKYLPL